MILIVSSPDDVHARSVSQKLELINEQVVFLDTFRCAEHTRLRYRVGRENEKSLVGSDGQVIPHYDIRTVWIRRPYPPRLREILDPRDRQFAQAEWHIALDGLFLSLDARFVNPRSCELNAVKPHQLEVARRVGLRVPDTLITNDQGAAQDFIRFYGERVVHKPMTAPSHRLLDTRRWTREDWAALDDLPLAPTIFQELITGPGDVRTTVIGKRTFSAFIATAQGQAQVDSRLDADAPCTPFELPSDVKQHILDLMQELGLLYGAIDLKLTDDGDLVFFEVNPQGQFLYIEILTGLPISQAMAELLAGD
ncbi:MAG: MvdC/MvdD family ATP grasp protein [Nitrospirota bacterium]